MKKYKNNSKGSTIVKILAILLVMAAVSALLSFNPGDTNITKPTTSTTDKPNTELYNVVYLVPSRDWASDGSGYAAWCFGGEGFPAPGHVSGTLNEETGVVEFVVPKGYTQILFIDLKPGTNFNGNWDNKRDQTADLEIPVDGNMYYHQYANEWSSEGTSSEREIVETTEETVVYVQQNGDQYISLYVFSKFNESAEFLYPIDQTGDLDTLVVKFVIPAGYTHCIVVQHSDGNLTWDNVVSQTSDMLIPENNSTFDFNNQTWIVE